MEVLSRQEEIVGGEQDEKDSGVGRVAGRLRRVIGFRRFPAPARGGAESLREALAQDDDSREQDRGEESEWETPLQIQDQKRQDGSQVSERKVTLQGEMTFSVALKCFSCREALLL